MPLSHYKAVFFDLDGTLIDSAKDLHFAINKMLTKTNKNTVELTEIKHWIGNGTLKLVQRALLRVNNGQHAPSDTEIQRSFHLFSRYYRECVGEYSTLFPAVKELLVSLLKEKTKVACITNKPLEFTESLLQQNMISQFFSVICAGDNVTYKKPDPWPLRHAAKKFNIDLSQCLMIGDSQHDIAAAKSAPCDVIAVSYGYNHGQDIALSKPNRIIDSLAELM